MIKGSNPLNSKNDTFKRELKNDKFVSFEEAFHSIKEEICFYFAPLMHVQVDNVMSFLFFLNTLTKGISSKSSSTFAAPNVIY